MDIQCQQFGQLNVSETLREHAKNVIDFEKKKNTVNKKKKN